MKGEWGTKFYDTDTTCDKCQRRAVGILKDVALYDEPYKGIRAGVPLCSNHRDRLKGETDVDWEADTFQRFID